MLLTLIQKEILYHILNVQFIARLLMCLLLIPLTLSINYGYYLLHLVDYREKKLWATRQQNINVPEETQQVLVGMGMEVGSGRVGARIRNKFGHPSRRN